MKRITILFIFSAFLFGCERITDPAPTPPSDPNTGKLFFSFDKQNAPVAVKTLVIALTRSGYSSVEKILDIASDSIPSIIVDRLATGIWNVKIDAKNPDGTVIYTGSSDVLVVENSISQVNVTLNPVATGVGGVQINVHWGSPVSLFPKSYGGAADDFAMAVIAAKDGGYLLGGLTRSVGQDGDAWVVKTDAKGTILWSKNYGTAYEDRVNSIVQTNDGGYILAGYINGGKGDSWLMKIDSVGKTQWEKNYGVPGDDSFLKIRSMSDGSFLVIGYTYLSEFSKGNFFDGRVVNISPDGAIIWSTTMGSNGGDYTTNFVEVPNNGIYISGTYGSNFENNYDLWLLKLDFSGNVLWGKTYGNQFEERSGGGMALTSDGALMMCGYRLTGSGQYGIIMKVDTSGNQQWIKEYPTVNGNLLTMQRLPDNTFIAAGYSGTTGYGQQGSVIQINNNGDLLWTHSYGGNGSESFSEIQLTRDNMLISAGSTTASGSNQRDFWLMKLNNSGVIQ